jgi:FKBP-type peptidyl-prolyl cis-trans isomerase
MRRGAAFGKQIEERVELGDPDRAQRIGAAREKRVRQHADGRADHGTLDRDAVELIAENVGDAGDGLVQNAAGRDGAIHRPPVSLQLTQHNRVQMKLIHLTGAAAALTVLALTAPAAISPAAAQGAPGKMSELPSGLKYTDSKVGDGAAATTGHKVSVHYTGWLDNNGEKGRKFDSSLDRGEPFSFTLGGQQVIKGWDQGVAGMKVGGKRTLIIPSELGYGARGAGGVIPPNATLIFDVELLKVD